MRSSSSRRHKGFVAWRLEHSSSASTTHHGTVIVRGYRTRYQGEQGSTRLGHASATIPRFPVKARCITTDVRSGVFRDEHVLNGHFENSAWNCGVRGCTREQDELEAR